MSKFASMGTVVDRPIRMEIYHPKTGLPLVSNDGEACYIDLYSIDSEVAQKYEREINNKRLTQRVRATITADGLEAEQVGRLAVVTVDWRLAGLDGSPLSVPCDKANAEELYREPPMRWLRDQVERFLGDRANFTQDSSKNSSPSPSSSSGSTAPTKKAQPSANT